MAWAFPGWHTDGWKPIHHTGRHVLKSFFVFLVGCLWLLTAGSTSAQGAPQHITDAFNDLNSRLGTSFTTANTRWTWSEEVWQNQALGCERLDTGDLAAEEIRGFRVRIDLDLTGAESWDYDYRISYAPDLLILCSPDLDTTTSAAPTTSPPETTPVICDPSVPPRLIAGEIARVTPGIPNNVRSGAGVSNEYLGEIPAEAIFTVIAGPVCASDLAWWQVEYNGMIGWTAEGQDGEYWLEPELAALQPITAENLGQLSLLAELPRPLISASHMQFDGGTLYVNGIDTVTAYRLQDAFAVPDAMQWQPEIIASLDPTLEAMFEDFVVLDDNTIRTLYVRNDFSQMWTAQAPGATPPQEWGAANPGIFRLSPDGRYVVRAETASGAYDKLFVYDLSSGQSWTIQNVPHISPVQAMAFSADSQYLMTASAELLIIWEVFAWNPAATDGMQVILSAQGYRVNDVEYVNQVAFIQGSEEFFVSTSDVALNSYLLLHGFTRGGLSSTEIESVIWKDVISLGDGDALLGGAYGGEGSLVALLDGVTTPLPIDLAAVRDMAFSADGRLLAVQTDTAVLLFGVGAE